jgi:hypothetical protein
MTTLGCSQQLKQPPFGQLGNSGLSGSDRHDFTVSQGLDIANWGLAKETPVLAIELACAFIADLERCTCRIQVIREHAVAPQAGEAASATEEDSSQ